MCEPIINVICTTGGIILGWFIEYKYKIFSHRRNRFFDACVEFEQSFAATRYWLNNEAVASPLHISGGLTKFKGDHITAVNNFRVFLPKKKWTDFDNACEKFFNKKSGEYYDGYGGDKRIASELALKNIDDLSHFSKH